MWNSRLQCTFSLKENMSRRLSEKTKKKTPRLSARYRPAKSSILFEMRVRGSLSSWVSFHERAWIQSLSLYFSNGIYIPPFPLPFPTSIVRVIMLTSASRDFLPLLFSFLSFVRTSRWRSPRASAWRRKSFGSGNAAGQEVSRFYTNASLETSSVCEYLMRK